MGSVHLAQRCCGDMTAHLHNLLLDLCVAVGGPIILESNGSAAYTYWSSGSSGRFAGWIGGALVPVVGRVKPRPLPDPVSAPSRVKPRPLWQELCSGPCARHAWEDQPPDSRTAASHLPVPSALPVRIAIPATMPPRHDERRPPEKVKSKKLVWAVWQKNVDIPHTDQADWGYPFWLNFHRNLFSSLAKT